jgi:ATP-binding cassette subfamily B protein
MRDEDRPMSSRGRAAPLNLAARRYSVLDSVGTAFRCAPLSTSLYTFLALAAGAVAPAQALLVARFIDATIAVAEGQGGLREAVLGLAGVSCAIAFLWLERTARGLAELGMIQGLRSRFRTALARKRARLAYRVTEDEASLDLVRRVASDPETGGILDSFRHLVELAAFVVKVGGLLVILSSIVWWGGPILLLVSSMTLATGIRGGKRQYEAEREASGHERRSDYLSSLLLGREAAAERDLFGFSERVASMWRASFGKALAIRTKVRIHWFLSAYAGNIVSQLSWITAMAVLLPSVGSGRASPGSFIALTQAFANLDIVWGFMETVHGISADAEYFKDLGEFAALEESPMEAIAQAAWLPMDSSIADGDGDEKAPPRAPTLRSIVLDGVEFAYPGAEEPVLRGLSCVFEPGRLYAVVGANGAGKTTLIRLLAGLYEPDRGGILVNGREVGELSREELAGFFSIVHQDFARYQLSLRDNITLGRPEGGLGAAVEKAGLTALVSRLSGRLDTHIGRLEDGGVELSGGEWQRVAMARALAAHSAVRILDEPTASLDPVAESRLYKDFGRITRGETTILVTHRLGAARLADTILVLEGGIIAESGNHGELMGAGGLYARMYESQRSWYA